MVRTGTSIDHHILRGVVASRRIWIRQPVAHVIRAMQFTVELR
jgi:hypothetical protein